MIINFIAVFIITIIFVIASVRFRRDDGFMAGENFEYQQEVYRLSKVIWAVFIVWILFVFGGIIIFVVVF